MHARPHASFVPLLLVSLTAIGFEILLTRYFAIANWSEYGYWVISIAMVGLCASGVVLSLFKDFFSAHADRWIRIIPLLLIVFACLGFYLTTINPFNPLEFQNRDVWLDQLLNIGKYYCALFPFFFTVGLYIGLYFLAFQEHIPQVYAADLVGAGAGALLVLFAMFWVHPFYLLTVLLPLLLLAGVWPTSAKLRPGRYGVAALALILIAGEAAVIAFNRADFNEYKSIYPALHVQGSKVAQTIHSPRGYFMVLDNFTERLDIDFSNNSALLRVADPPSTLGLYNDGNRLTSLPKTPEYNPSYIKAALDAFPFEVKRAPRALLIGTRGGFRLREALSQGASSILALEPDAALFQLIRERLPQDLARDARVVLSQQSPAMLTATAAQRFDIVDIAQDFLNQADANKFAFTVDAVQGYFGILKDDGWISLPVSIREFTVYTVKMLETVRTALAELGVARPMDHIMVYRSSWNARILVGKRPFTAADIRSLRAFCAQRSFDTSYFPGIDPAQVQIWNDLPLVSFKDTTIISSRERASDALMTETLKLFSEERAAFLRTHFFNLAPSTYDRPFFYSILRLGELKDVLRKIALIPREEIGYLINVAVLLQALLFAVLVLGLPLLRREARRLQRGLILRSIIYFAGLGLGFLFLEIFLIEKASFFLNDRTSAFAVVLAGMLMFSGAGSYLAGAYLDTPRRGIRLAALAIFAWVLLAWFLLDPILLALLPWPFAAKCTALLVLLAPVSVALGFPFPLGLSLFRGDRSRFLPWAWSLNGAFSVIATPLANLLAVSAGYKMVLLCSLLLYVVVLLSFPLSRARAAAADFSAQAAQ